MSERVFREGKDEKRVEVGEKVGRVRVGEI